MNTQQILSSVKSRMLTSGGAPDEDEYEPEQRKLITFLELIGVPKDYCEEISFNSEPGANRLEARLSDRREFSTILRGITKKLGAPALVKTKHSSSTYQVWKIRGKGEVFLEEFNGRSFYFHMTSK